MSRITERWRRMATIYRRFASDYPRADFSEQAAQAMFDHESRGTPMPNADNGFALGKKWLGVTVAGWMEEIPQLGLLVDELRDDGYPDWFLSRVGVLQMKPRGSACAWWLGEH